MKFFMDRYGDEYPVSEIVRIHRAPPKPEGKPTFVTRYQTVDLRSGERVEVADYTVSEITTAPSMMVPAHPGTFILGGVEVEDTSPTDVWQTPVIAFAIGIDKDVTPWTVDGPNDGVTHPGPLLMPNGMVVELGDRCHRSIDEWFAERQAELKRDKEAKSVPATGTAD